MHSMGGTHINTYVEQSVLLDLQQAIDLRTRCGRTSIVDAGSWRGIDNVRQQVNVRFCSHNRLKSDIALSPKSAMTRLMHRSKKMAFLFDHLR
jgi:hypothetical protein